jgi:signal transduction histidine kinase
MGTTKLRTYVSLVVLAATMAIVLAGSVVAAPSSQDAPAIAAFALAFVLVQLLPVPFPRGTQLELVRVEEAVVVPLVLLLEPSSALVAVAIGILVGQLAERRATVPPLKLWFNAAQLVLSVAAALAVTAMVAGEWAPGFGPLPLLAAAAGLVAMFLVNQLLVAGVLRLAAGTPMRDVLREDIALKAGMWAANASIGMLLVLPATESPWVLCVAFVPLVMLHAAWRVHAGRAREEQRLHELGAAVGGMSGEVPVERVARALAESARDVVDCAGAEVRLFEDGRRFWSRRTEDGTSSGEGRRDDASSDASATGRITFCVPLAGSQGTFGELVVWHERTDSDGMRASFTRRDRTLVEMLAHQATSALDNSLLSARTALQQRTIAQVFDHSSEGMLVLDRRGRVCGWNPAMQALSGFEETVVSASPISLISPQLAAIVQANGPGTIDATLSTSSGEHRHVRASYAPIASEEDEPAGAGAAERTDTEHSWVVVLRDVTLEQETERLKDDFVATVSHELRTPLTAIKGFLETMRRDDIDLGEGQVRMFLQIMGEQADRLERLIGDLLDMSAIESGRPLEVEVAPIDLGSTVRRAVKTFEAARPTAVVRFDAPRMGMVVDADAHRLEQVVTNLLDNALKHGGAGTPIDVILDQDDAGRCAVAVADRGPGISQVDQRRIFERFYVTSNSVTRTGGGAGLGLYICRRLVSAMDGTIEVHSTLGEGTTFRVALPTVASSLPGIGSGGAAQERPRVGSDQ